MHAKTCFACDRSQVLQSVFGFRALLLLLCSLFAHSLPGATLSDAQVDRYNVRVGTQTFAGLYQFTTNTLLVETAQAIQDMGSDILKMYLASDFPKQYRITLPANVTNLVTLARDEPSCRRVLDMPFRHIVAWTYPFANWWPFDGYSATERANEYKEIYDLTRYLLTNYNNSDKTFYLGHWEGDWYLLPNYNSSTNPTPTAIQGMVDWLNNRQKAVDDAKRDTPFTNVNVFNYAEVNRVLDAMSGNTNINQRAINRVIPYVTNLDCLSWSSYDGMNLDLGGLNNTLNYMQSMLPTNKAASFPGQRIWVGEYGWGNNSFDSQETLNRTYVQKLLTWGVRFILYWEIYDNEKNADGTYRNFCLIDSNNNKVPSYYLHQRFLNRARLAVAQFQETNHRLPNEGEFAALLTPTLAQPLSPPINLLVRNAGAKPLTPALSPSDGAREGQTNSAVEVSGTLAQGVYGDDAATMWVFWGRQDGGTVQSAWEGSRNLGLNTNFNPATFSCVLSNLVANTNYFFRFYATNASGEAWAPASAQMLAPLGFGSRLKITFAGYTRGEPLTNFPVLVTLSTNLASFSYRQFASPLGADLRFTDASGGQVICHEIDEWNTNGTSYVWVQVPLLATTNDYIRAYWGNPSATNPPAYTTDGSVWAPDGDLVWHLKETGLPFADSAQQHPAVSGVAPASASGLIGRGSAFNGSSQYLNAGPVNLGTAFTLSAWVKLDATANNIQTVWANKGSGWNANGFALYVNSYNTADQKLLLETGDGTAGGTAATLANVVTPGQWHRVSAVIDEAKGAARLYVDGADYTQTSSIRNNFQNQGLLNLGRFTNNAYYFKGVMDEVRVESGLRSSNWLWASWMTVASNSTLASYAAVQQQSPALSLSTAGGGLSLSWPASGVGFMLFTATNLALPVLWTLATNRPVLLDSQWQVRLSPATNGPRFYRLQSP